MALPTVPTTVLSAVSPEDMGKAAGINNMAQRLGTVFALAIASAAFSANGRLGDPASVTHGFRSAMWVCTLFAATAAISATGIRRHRGSQVTQTEAADLQIAA
jgi:MFS family permease